MGLIFKICGAGEWPAAGLFLGSAIDLEDGFVHLSSAAQVRETAAKYFAEAEGLVLIAFDPQVFGPLLKWEPSRGGALFPHVYGPIDAAAASWVKPLPFVNGAHVFPPETFA